MSVRRRVGFCVCHSVLNNALRAPVAGRCCSLVGMDRAASRKPRCDDFTQRQEVDVAAVTREEALQFLDFTDRQCVLQCSHGVLRPFDYSSTSDNRAHVRQGQQLGGIP